MRLPVIFSTCALVAFLAFTAFAQENPTPAPVPTEPKAALRALRDSNAEQIKKQEALLERLDELDKNASQLRIFTRRS